MSGKTRWSEGILPLVLLLCLVTAASLGLYALSFLRTVLVSERGSELAMNAAAVAGTVDRVLYERFGDIQWFASDGILLDGTSEQKTARLLRYKQLYWYYSWLGVTDETGQLITATDVLADPVRQQLSRDTFESVRRTGTVHLEDVSPSSGQEGTQTVGFTAPMYGKQGEFRGAVISRVPIKNLRTIFEQEGRLRYGDNTYDWVLLNHDGTIITEKHPETQMTHNLVKVELPSQARATSNPYQPGFVEEIHHRRGESIVTGYARTQGYKNFQGFDWVVLFRLSHDKVYAPIDQLLWTVGGIGLLVVLPLTGFGIWASWKLGRERNDLVRTRQELEKSVAELGRSNAELQQFAYVASHDLQEPLRMVSSYTQLLGRRYKGRLDADADEFIAYAVDGALRMQRLIQDLLVYSRVSTKARTSDIISVEVVLAHAQDNLQNAIKESQAVVTHDSLPAVRGDERQLVQLFQNLLSNAIKFHGLEPPKIHVSATRSNGEWRFSVRDCGIGLDPQYADRIFVIFQRLHNRAEYPGTGIGLAICKKIIEHHGGRIGVESESGKGAAFWFTIPDHSDETDKFPGTDTANRGRVTQQPTSEEYCVWFFQTW
ncbi:MAG: putative Sensor histidine kinase with region [Nitrospira sp.]|nr:putative Sensor histidine kinase with region [Nitrospira sp.]